MENLARILLGIVLISFSMQAQAADSSEALGGRKRKRRGVAVEQEADAIAPEPGAVGAGIPEDAGDDAAQDGVREDETAAAGNAIGEGDAAAEERDAHTPAAGIKRLHRRPAEDEFSVILAPDTNPILGGFILEFAEVLRAGMIDPLTRETGLHKLLKVTADRLVYTNAALTFLCTHYAEMLRPFTGCADRIGWTPLARAIHLQNEAAVMALLPLTDLTVPLMIEEKLTTYAHLAAVQPNENIFSAVIAQLVASCSTPAEKTSLLGARDHSGNTVAQIVVLINNPAYLKVLVQNPELPVFKLTKAKESLLLFTMGIAGDRKTCIEVLIEDAVLARFKGLATQADAAGNTPLHRAAMKIQETAYEHMTEPNPEAFASLKQLLSIHQDAISAATAPLNFSARNRAGKTALQLIENEGICAHIVAHYKRVAPAIGTQLEQ